MVTHYYISADNEKGFEKVTESEWKAMYGDEATAPYAQRVYRGEITSEDVPEEYREVVRSIVDFKIQRFGEYHKREVTAAELKNMIEEVL